MIIRLVLSTDLANHFDYIARLNTKLDSAEVVHNSPKASSAPVSFGDSASQSDSPSANIEPLILMETAMKMSDVANGARGTKIYNEWSARVFQEFYLQGDQEVCSSRFFARLYFSSGMRYILIYARNSALESQTSVRECPPHRPKPDSRYPRSWTAPTRRSCSARHLSSSTSSGRCTRWGNGSGQTCLRPPPSSRLTIKS